jgi:hypothetical protein
MQCLLCKWLCDRFCPPEWDTSAYWNASSAWEETYAQDWEPWPEDQDLLDRAISAADLIETDPTLALQKFAQFSDEGSAYAMRWAGTLLTGRHGITPDLDLAEEYFRRAICAGSWMATLAYSHRLFERGAHDLWPGVLKGGIDKGFIPAFFWHGWNTYRLKPSNRAALESRPLLLKAAEREHPGARMVLAQWTAKGRFGLRQIPEGIAMMREAFDDFDASVPTG